MSEQIPDSRKKSLSEAFANSFGGYPIGYGLGIVILPLSMGWIQERDRGRARGNARLCR